MIIWRGASRWEATWEGEGAGRDRGREIEGGEWLGSETTEGGAF